MSGAPSGAAVGLAGSRLTGSKGQRYFLQRQIGRGTFAVVYRCLDETDPERTKFACKVIAKALLTEQARANLLREIAILREVHHENVLCMHDLLETEQFLFIILPLMEGGELFEKISRSGQFSEAKARNVLTQIAKGLEYLHSHGICHRDIKPENILCTKEDENFRVVITDFGLSKLYGRGELMTTSCGTLHYAAPEVVAHRSVYDEKCDMWGYGVVAFVLLTGCFPFHHKNQLNLQTLILSGKYDTNILRIRGVSAAACAFIARLLSLDPAQRPTASEVLADPWLVGTDLPHVDLSKSAGILADLPGDDDMIPC